ncbi:MAG: hypothetical protein KGI00_03035 [Candidatus Micrarchaeota archaeon]|nr:hypothetical protein [Candidatus Micrarchaeota archaeon]
MQSFDLYTRGFGILKDNPIALVPVVAIFFAVFLVAMIAAAIAVAFFVDLGGASSSAGIASILVPAILAVVIIVLLLSLSVGVIIQGMYVAIAQQGLRGRISLQDAFDLSLKRVKDLFLFNILCILIVAVIAIAVIAISMGSIESLLSYLRGYSQGTGSSIALILAVLGTILPMVIEFWIAMFVINIAIYAAVPLIVLEKLGPLKAVRRSIGIAKKRYLSIISVQLLGAIVFGALYGLQVFLNFIPLLGWIASVAISIFGTAWMQIIPTLFYFSYVKGKPRS